MTQNTKSILTISASPEFKQFLKECSSVYKMTVSQLIRCALYDYVNNRTNGAVYGKGVERAYENYCKNKRA